MGSVNTHKMTLPDVEREKHCRMDKKYNRYACANEQ